MGTRTVSAVLALALSLHAGAALAADTAAGNTSPYGDRDMENIDLANAYEPSPLYVYDLRADQTPSDDGLIHGTFVAQNAGDDIVPDLTYRIDIYGATGTPAEDTLMDRVQGGAFVAVAPQSTRSVDFTYKPLLPAGEYTLRIQILSGNGRPFGWRDSPFTITSGAATYVEITPGALLMPEYDNQPLEPLTGPNIDPKGTFTIGASFRNPGTRSITVVPTLNVYEFDSSQSRVDTLTYDPVTLAAGETRELTLPVTSNERPEVYFAELVAMQKGTRVSGLAEYRWVVRGQDANIIAARIETLGLKKDDHTFVRVDYAGPADAETKLRGTLHVTLRDDEGTLGELTVRGVELADEIGSGIARIKLTRDMVGSPSIEVSITDNNDTVLAHYGQSSTIPSSTLQTIADNGIAKQWFRWYATPHALLTILLFVAAAIACAFLVRFMSSLTSSRGVSRVLSALLVTAMMLHTSSALANGITVVQPKTFLQGHPDWYVLGNRPAVELFINKPVHDAPSCTYQDLERVPFEYRVDFGVCLNRPAVVRVIARYDKNGGKHSNLNGNNQSDWKEVHDQTYFEQSCGAYLCVTSKNYSGTVDLSGVKSGATSTTLQVAAKWTWNGQFVPNDTIDASDGYISQGHDSVAAHVVNLWINLCPVDTDLRIQKTAPATVVRGNTLTYGITVENRSNGVANNVTITDPIPSGLTYLPAQSDTRCTQQQNNIVCSFPSPIPAQGSRTVNLTFATSPTLACDPGTITNTATVSSSTTDTNTSNNTSTATTQVNCPQVQNPDVQIQKSGPTSVTRGSTFSYTLTATNISQTTANNVVVTDTLPNGVNYVSSSNDCSVNGSTVTCQAGTLNASQSRTFTITVSTPAVSGGQSCNSYPSSVTNTGVVSATNDSNSGNNQSSVTTQINCPQVDNPDVSIQKSGPTSVTRGSTFSYTLTATNVSQVAANNVVVTDTIPNGLTYVSSSNDCSISNNVVTCTAGTITAGNSRTFTITVSSPAVTSGQSCESYPSNVTNTGTVSASNDSNSGNNQSSVTTQLNCPQQNPDVQIQKSGPTSVMRGENFTYTLSATNVGQSSAQNVVVTDVIPSSLTYVSSSNDCSVNGSTVTCQAGTLSAGQNRTFSITVNAPAATGGQSCTSLPSSVTNTGTVSASNDSNSGNNQSSVTTQINCPGTQMGCIDIVKETYNSLGNQITPVTQFTFSLDSSRTTTNDSNGHARFDNVSVGSHTVTESIPSGWNQLSVAPSNGVVYVTAGSCATVTFKNKQNTIAVNEGFTISKTDHRSTAEAGDTLTYEITVKNVGLTRQTNVTVTDTLPRDVEFIDASPNEDDEDGREIVWEDLTFEAGETKVFEVEVEIDDDFEGTLTNIARVKDKEAEDRTRVEDNNDNNDDDDVEIKLTKMASTSEVFPGGIIDYTVTIKNTGNDTIEDLLVRDTLPADVVVIDDGDADDRNGRILEWEIDELEEDDTVTLRYRVSVPTYMVPGQTIRNDVRVTNDDDDIDERASVTVIVIGTIPQTGMRGSVGGNHLTPINRDSSSGGTALPFLASIALAGVGTGVGFGRRKLLGF